MMQPRTLCAIGLVASLIAAYLSGNLLKMHAVGTADLGFLAGACGSEGEGCEKVITSRWGLFPPGPAEDEASTGPSEDAAGGIPVAAIGLFYFSALAIWFGAIGRARGRRKNLQTALTGVVILGAVGSIAFLGIMWGAIGSTCVLCLGSHLANFAIVAVVVLLQKVGDDPDAATWPDLRLGAVVACLIVAVWAAEWNAYKAAKSHLQTQELAEVRAALAQENEFRERMADLEELGEAADKLEAIHLGTPKQELGIRDDDPRIPRGKGLGMQLTVFADIECEHCAAFYDFLKKELLPLFNGHLEVVHKHYPLNVHKNAKEGARALEAARLQGKYWEMHDYLHERREILASIDYAAAARELGLDPNRFVSDMRSDRVWQRILHDMNVGRKNKLTKTPAVYLNGRPVQRLFRRNLGFWKLRIDMLKKARARAKQGW